MDWLGAVATGIGNLVDSLVGNQISYKTSKKIMDYQYKLNQQGIDTANRYNLPINQLSRLRDAGLNANLVYGNGTVAGLTSSGEASTSQGLKQMSFNSGVGDAAQFALQQKQYELNEKSTNQAVGESLAKQSYYTQLEKESQSREYNNWLDAGFAADSYDTRLHQLRRHNTEIEKGLEEKSQNIAESYSRQRVNEEKLKEIDANIDYIKARTGLTENQALTELCKPALIRSQVSRNSKLNELTDKQIELYGWLILQGRADYVRKDLQNYMDFERENYPESHIRGTEPDDLVNDLIDAVCKVAAVSVKAL